MNHTELSTKAKEYLATLDHETKRSRIVTPWQHAHEELAGFLGWLGKPQAAAIPFTVVAPNPEPSEPAQPENDACCDNEQRNMNGGCDNCGDPCL